MNENQVRLKDAGTRERDFVRLKVEGNCLPSGVAFGDVLAVAVYDASRDEVVFTIEQAERARGGFRDVTYRWRVGPLKNYFAWFSGCTIGAIGIRYDITASVVARNEEEARLALYERYDHISGLVLRARGDAS